MQRRLFSILALPMLLVAQCAPDGCAPAPGGLRPGTTIPVGRIVTYGFGGHAGADYLDAVGEPDPRPGWRLLGAAQLHPDGVVEGGGFPVQPSGVRMSRLEFYPDMIYNNWGSYDAWHPALTVGGLHLWNPDGRAVNHLVLPHASNGAVRYFASVSDGGRPVADGRMRVHVFGLVNKDTSMGAFNISANRGNQWTAGWIWPGTYEAFFFDDATGRSVYKRVDLRPEAPLALDLSQNCFGLGSCN